MQRKSFYRTLYGQVLLAIALGALLGCLHPATAVALKPLSEGFVRLIKMLTAPLIFATVVTGIAGSEDMKRVGRTGGLALLYFELVSSLALLIGLCVVNLVRPGAGMHIDPHSLDATAISSLAGPKSHPLAEFLLNIIPHTVVAAFAEGEMLQVLLFSVLFGVAVQRVGGRASPLFELIDRFARALFVIVEWVMRLSPVGAFSAMAFTVGLYGIGSLLSLGKLMAVFYATCLLFVFGVLGTIARVHGFSVARLILYLKDELLIVLGTSSSESVMARMLRKLEALGARKSVVGLVLPTGYSFNLDGTSIYLTMAAVFVAQATDTPLGWLEQLTLLGVLLLSSKGAAAVTGSAFIVLAGTLASQGSVPVAGLTLLLGVDRFMSEARAVTNLIGNAVATLVVAQWTGGLDRERLRAGLSQTSSANAKKRSSASIPLSEPV